MKKEIQNTYHIKQQPTAQTNTTLYLIIDEDNNTIIKTRDKVKAIITRNRLQSKKEVTA